jgi:hypothetical protein
MGKLKKIGIGIIAFFGILIVLGMIGSTVAPTGKALEIQQTQILITKSALEMLPVRAEIPTEFTIDETKDVMLNASGFESGKELSTSKLEGTTGMIFIDYIVYKFSTASDATLWYSNRINEIKQVGGYKEIDIYGCFAYKEDFGFTGEVGEGICIKNNVIYIADVTSAQTYKQIDSFMKDATNTLGRKI